MLLLSWFNKKIVRKMGINQKKSVHMPNKQYITDLILKGQSQNKILPITLSFIPHVIILQNVYITLVQSKYDLS